MRPGDTLSEIGARYDVSVDELARANRLVDPNRIAVDQALWIPAHRPPSVASAPAKRASPTRVARTPRGAKLDARLERADELLRTARFEDALAELERARRDVARLEAGDAPASGARRARLEVMAGTAWVALGEDVAADRSFERALRADAGLTLDPARHAPKVIRSFEQSRRRLAGANAPPDAPVDRVAELAPEP